MDNTSLGEKLEILKLLISNKEELYSIRKIALLRNINYKSAYTALKALQKEGAIDLKKTGNTTICSFTNTFNELVYRAEYSRRADLFKDRTFPILYASLSKLELPLFALLFGSYAKGSATKHSDIDLLVVSEEKYFKKIEETLKILPQEIHLTTLTYESFMRMATSKNFNVVNEALKKNIILLGIEEYYRLLNNARTK